MTRPDDGLPAWERSLSPLVRWLLVAVYSVSFGATLGALYLVSN